MQEFPKMLYIGSTQSHKPEIAQNQDLEDELRDLGFVEFADLENEAEQISAGLGSASSEDFKNAFVSVEQFDAVSEELVQKELQLNVAQTERDDFKAENDDLKNKLSNLDKAYSNVIDDFNASNQKYIELGEKFGEAQAKHYEFQNNVEAMKARIAEIQGDTTPVGTVSESPDYNSLTTPQLQKLLDEKGIAYLKRDDKATLIALLTQPVKTEE